MNSLFAVAPLEGDLTPIRLSHYWPPLGGTNCGRWANGQCISHTANGERWEDWVGRGAACPREWAFGTEIVLPGGERFVCVDRGGAIEFVGGVPWVDLLVEIPPVPFGTVVEARVIRK